MIYYVSHKYQNDPANLERARKITHDLQVSDTENSYLCPLLAMSHLAYGEIGWDAEMEICKDLLSVCDCLIVASDVSEGVREEIDFATLVGMEVIYLEEQNT